MVLKNKLDIYSIIKLGTQYIIELDTGRAKYDFIISFRSQDEALDYLQYTLGPYPSLSLDEWRYHSYREEE
jgi:hypothetical protein